MPEMISAEILVFAILAIVVFVVAATGIKIVSHGKKG